MRYQEIVPTQAIDVLSEAPVFAELQGRDGLSYRVWKNPSIRQFSNAIRRTSTTGLRGLITGVDLYVWQSMSLLHTDFERDTSMSGIRLALRAEQVQVNDETVDQPEHFPWVFPQPERIAEMDIEDRREIVAKWLMSNARLKRLYPSGFQVTWYL